MRFFPWVYKPLRGGTILVRVSRDPIKAAMWERSEADNDRRAIVLAQAAGEDWLDIEMEGRMAYRQYAYGRSR